MRRKYLNNMHPRKPPHLFLNNSYYFITSRTYRGQRIFNSEDKKMFLISSLKAAVRKGQCDLLAWVILEDHYHFLIKCPVGKYIPKLMNFVHGRVSYYINQMDNKRGRFVFNNYWDHIIRDQRDMNIHLNYILYNPVKHGYVDNPEDYNMVWVKDL